MGAGIRKQITLCQYIIILLLLCSLQTGCSAVDHAINEEGSSQTTPAVADGSEGVLPVEGVEGGASELLPSHSDVEALTDSSYEAGIVSETESDSLGEAEKVSKAAADSQLESEVSSKDEERMTAEVERLLNTLTLEEKVAQLFVIFPEALVNGVPCVTAAGAMTKEAFNELPVGGIVYLSQNLKNPDQVKKMLANVQAYSMERVKLPVFLCVDEEGGRISRIANNSAFGVENVGNMAEVGKNGNSDQAYLKGIEIGGYLSELGFNLDFAPVADVKLAGKGYVIGNRAFSEDPDVVSDMTSAFVKGLSAKGIVGVYKHFPGHGSTIGDPHKGYAYTDKTLSELEQTDLIPFAKGIENDVPMIMVGHISTPQIVEDGTPASLSKEIIDGLLREKMGYDGIVITDAMNMGAISDRYNSGEAALMAIEAGADLILAPKNFREAYQGVIDAVDTGALSEERLDASVRRVLTLKLKMQKAME